MKMKLALLLPVLAALRVCAHTFDSHYRGTDPSGGQTHQRNHADFELDTLSSFKHQRRATRSKCSVPIYQAQAKRDAAEILERNYTLQRRTMTLPGSDMDKFMVDEMTARELRPIIWGKKVKGQWEDMATSDFEEFKDEAFSLGTPGLCGCTTLLIVSRKAVYYAHYWENISFAPDDVFMKLFKDVDQAFEKTVIKGLTQGIKKEQTSLRGYAERIDDEHVRGYLMIPHQTWDDIPDGYRAKWNRIKSVVSEFIPRLKDSVRWKEITYEALDKSDPLLDSTARGKILFKFDPNHKTDANKKEGKKKATLWIESNRNPHHDDEW